MWLACIVCHPFLTILWFPFPLWLALLRDWALLDNGLFFSPAHPFSCYPLLPYHSIIPIAKLFASILLVLLLHHWRAPMSHLFSSRRLGPICFPWASSTIFFTLHSHGFLLNSLGFPNPITLSIIIGVHRLDINPLPSLLSLLWACRGPFLFFHIIYCQWFSFSLFSGSFKPIYLLKAHFFI